MVFILILDQILFINNLKKGRKKYFRSDCTVFRSNSTFLDQILLILKKIVILSNSTFL